MLEIMSELQVKMKAIEIVSKFVIQQQKEYEDNPMYNEYMRLSWNLNALKSAIKSLEDELNKRHGG
jgi:hypothetical protein